MTTLLLCLLLVAVSLVVASSFIALLHKGWTDISEAVYDGDWLFALFIAGIDLAVLCALSAAGIGAGIGWAAVLQRI